MRLLKPGLAAVVIVGISSAAGLYLYPDRSVGSAPPQLCEDYSGQPLASEGSLRHGMLRLEGGTFTLGSDRWYREERPAHAVSIDGFWIDRHPVTNAQFARFVADTGYVTQAEKGLPKAYSQGLPASVLVPGSLVFGQAKGDGGWRFVAGANWKHPYGPESNIAGRGNHPVVQVTHADAQAYAQWAGSALPSEAQWEYAARGGLADADFFWGNIEDGKPEDRANVWQGKFPVMNLALDGYRGTSPVGCYLANGFDLVDMGGNVWELTDTWYRPGHAATELIDPQGPAHSLDPRDPSTPVKVIKGGSHLCSADYCLRYRPSARQPQAVYLATPHIGFRTVSKEVR